jgi:DNA polymerase-3 subunit epsilon
MKTVALDFETACSAPGNACQLGLAFVEGERITRIEERYIRPRDMRFTFSWLHGIRAEHVWDKPEFPEVLAEFHDELEGALILAHNAGFDAAVMRGCGRVYGQRLPRMRYLCTLWIARRVWPQLPSKSLANMARHLGIRFKHHNAAEDAMACATVAIAAARRVNALEICDIPARLEVWRPPEVLVPAQEFTPPTTVDIVLSVPYIPLPAEGGSIPQ